MLCRKLDRLERRKDPSGRGYRRRAEDAPRGDKHKDVATGFLTFISRLANRAALCALVVAGLGPAPTCAEATDFGVYARAVEFCRGTVKRPMALDLDKRVLCFDGEILQNQDISPVNGLVENGLFVVRSVGGESRTAMVLADLLRDRHATVIVYDYCFSACASYLLVASAEAFVLKDSLVAWHNTMAPLCPSLEVSKDGGPRRLEKLPCSDSPLEYQRGWDGVLRRIEQFFKARAVDPPLEWPPESFTIRKILRSLFEETGTYPEVLWTWNPRYHASTLKTRIVYEAYPNSQDEVNVMASKLSPRLRILYDP